MRSCGINYSTTVTGILVEELGRHFRYYVIAGWIINNNGMIHHIAYVHNTMY